MRLTVIFDDSLVIKDGVARKVVLPDLPDLWAIQWDGSTGHFEYRDQAIPNARVETESELAPFLSLWQAADEEARLAVADVLSEPVPSSTEIASFDILLTAMAEEGVISHAEARAVATRTREALQG